MLGSWELFMFYLERGKRKMDKISCLVLVEKEPEKVTKDEVEEVLQQNDGDFIRLPDFQKQKLVWGYLCKVEDYHRYHTMDMDKVILMVDDEGEVFSYEHTGNYGPEIKEGMEVVGLMDENAEIEPIGYI